MKRTKASAVCLAVLIGLMWLVGVGTVYADDNPPALVGRISNLQGKVSFLPAGQEQWSEATLNYVVTTGDRIYTEKDARAEIEAGRYVVRLNEKTDLVVTNLTEQTMQLGLQGTLRLGVSQLLSNDTVEVDTPNGALTVRAPGTYRAEMNKDGTRTLVRVDQGRLEITGGGVSQTVETGQAVELTGQGPILVSQVSLPKRDGFDKWCDERDKRLAASTSSKYVSTATPGYEELDANGRWTESAEYGPVWYPTVAVTWVPFRFGHWSWIGPWGWTWVEGEPWGFCPFHYGRWVFVGGAWGWIPGPIVPVPVFTPGLVAFIGGPSLAIGVDVNFVGWFPLGPAEPFFPWYHYGGDYLRVVNITNVRNVTNIENIINVRNINDVHYAYKTVAPTVVPSEVFRGGVRVADHVVKVPPEQLMRAQVVPHAPVNPTTRAALSGRPVRPPPVRTLPAAAHPAVRPGVPAVRPSMSGAPTPAPVKPTPARIAGPPFITRAAPPPAPVPFSRIRPAMVAHPGRPLEPAQIANLRAGRPAGPMLDREFPPHIAPVMRATPVVRPRPPHR